MDIAYYMVMTLISSNVCFMLSLWTLNIVSILPIEGMCVATLPPAMMTSSGSTFHPPLIVLSISSLYFCIF